MKLNAHRAWNHSHYSQKAKPFALKGNPGALALLRKTGQLQASTEGIPKEMSCGELWAEWGREPQCELPAPSMLSGPMKADSRTFFQSTCILLPSWMSGLPPAAPEGSKPLVSD